MTQVKSSTTLSLFTDLTDGLLATFRGAAAPPPEGSMPSASFLQWQNQRMPRLRQLDVQCAASLGSVPPNASLSDENLRGYVVLLSAHFQGFCRDLYTEAAQVIASKVRKRLQLLIQDQFTAHRALDHGNPNVHNIAKDFNRFGFGMKAELDADPANAARLQDLAALNTWRNVAAHQGTNLPPGPFDLPSLRAWHTSCDGLATALDAIMYNQLRRLLRRAPW
jgi:hypothetical protein